LTQQLVQFLLFKGVVDGDNANTGLLKELHMGSWDIAES
jgi:hypothetical protein